MERRDNSLPEITVKGVILGVVLAMILAAANAYLGLFAGMTVSATIPAAVISMGVLFTIPLRRSFIVGSELQFPEGIATAKVLESGQNKGEGLRQITHAGLAGGLFKVASDLVGLWAYRLATADRGDR